MAKKKKKKRVFKIKNICILLGILLLIIGISYYLITMPIKNIYIKGNKIISDNEIIESANLYHYPSFLLTKKSQIKKDIKQNQYIKSVDISKKIEDKDEEVYPVYEKVIAIARKEAERLLDILGIYFDSWRY